MSSHSPLVRQNMVVGNDADKTIVLGFKPKKVTVLRSDGVEAVKLPTMGDGVAFQRNAAGLAAEADVLDLTNDGFTLKAALNAAGTTLHYEAVEEYHD